MSLSKQLWLYIVLLMFAAFIGSFLVSCYSAKYYLEELLYQKNNDTVSSMALTLSNNAHDPVSMELFINAQFDSGHYDWIRLVGVDNQVIAERTAQNVVNAAPNWFTNFFAIETQPGVAQISSGWQQVGTLKLASTVQFAYKELWATVKRLFYYFFAMGLVSCITGSLLLKFITKPLNKAVSQAEAIGERRFITADEPKTKEFKAVIRSMNKLSAHVKSMLEDETSKLEKLRQSIQTDEITGLLNREPMLGHLRSFLQREDIKARGLLLTLRIDDLFGLNQSEGRANVDSLLKRFATTLQGIALKHNGFAGRLNGSDLLILLPECDENSVRGDSVLASLHRDCKDLNIANVKILGSSTTYQSGENVSQLLTRLDSVLESSGSDDTAPFIHVTSAPLKIREDIAWNTILDDAITNRNFVLQLFPVYSSSDELIHFEAPVRLVQQGQELMRAGIFMPHVSRLKLADKLDLIVLQLAIEEISKNQQAIGINVSASLLLNSHAMVEFVSIIKAHPNEAELLWLEIPEYGAFQNMENFAILCRMLEPLKCKIGIEHVAKEFSRIGELHDLGLDYIKIDNSLIHNINNTMAVQVFLRGLCTIVHSIGLKAIAEGVETQEEWNSLKELGVDGGTGEFFPRD
ncbi:RNase E specificity factor CsrD [Thalassocella blandensis]|nr:RNase E specificity factor CsrD [Thalassocella blandensis]